MPLQRILIGMLLVASATKAQVPTPPPLSPADVDVYVVAEMARMHIPGVSLAVVKAGKVVYAKGYGFADLERRDPVTPETVFRIGSASKQFIATGIMLLAQDGKLSVDDPVTKYFPDAPPSCRFAAVPTGGEVVVLQRLLLRARRRDQACLGNVMGCVLDAARLHTDGNDVDANRENGQGSRSSRRAGL
jgi:CubicO group peptidase (beta-lactamase class C family)